MTRFHKRNGLTLLLLCICSKKYTLLSTAAGFKMEEKPASAVVIQCVGLFAFSLLLISFVFYQYVIICMIKAKLWKQTPFYLVLLSLGLADNCCIVALLYIYATAAMRHSFLSLFARTMLGIFIDWTSLVMHWHYLFIAIIRAISVLFPVRSQIWFTLKRIVGACVAFWLVGMGQWGIFGGVTKDIIHFDIMTFRWTLSYPDQFIEIPGGVYGTFYNLVGFSCMLLYFIAFTKLRKTTQESGSTLNLKAQWNLLKLGFTCMIFVLSSGIFWQAATFGWFGTGFWVSCSQSLLHILLLGMNPFIYVSTSSQIRSAVPLICHKSATPAARVEQGAQNSRGLRNNSNRGRIRSTTGGNPRVSPAPASFLHQRIT